MIKTELENLIPKIKSQIKQWRGKISTDVQDQIFVVINELVAAQDKIAELEKERDEALILCDFKDKDIDACASVLSNIYSSGVNLEELERDVKYILIDHTYASSTNGKAFEAHNLEQQAKVLQFALENITNPDLIYSRLKALKDGK
jgi:hypothetical protein